jgi:type 1 glutamine amidotransferase
LKDAEEQTCQTSHSENAAHSLERTLYMIQRSIGPLLLFSVCLTTAIAQPLRPRVLIFSKTNGYHHASIPDGIAAIIQLGKEHGFDADTTTNTAWFTADTLSHYAALVFLSPSGDLFTPEQKTAFQQYIRGGGGFAGIHAASTPEKSWTWYGHLVGAVFNGHPPDPVPGTIIVADHDHAATRHLSERWKWKDEWYNFRNIVPGLHVLLKADETSYQGGTHGPNHPLAWYHAYDGGRAFYTALGHLPEAYQDPLFLQHISGGIQYAIGIPQQ